MQRRARFAQYRPQPVTVTINEIIADLEEVWSFYDNHTSGASTSDLELLESARNIVVNTRARRRDSDCFDTGYVLNNREPTRSNISRWVVEALFVAIKDAGWRAEQGQKRILLSRMTPFELLQELCGIDG